MSGLSLPVSRPTGRALLVASTGNRAHPQQILTDLGFETTPADDPYAAMTELCRRPLVYRAMIVSLASLYREELAVIGAVKSRYPHVEVWLAHTDGRQAALAEAMRLGADGLLAEDGLHRIATGPAPAVTSTPPVTEAGATGADGASDASRDKSPAELAAAAHDDSLSDMTEGSPGPILTPDELRALLHEQSPVPPDEN